MNTQKVFQSLGASVVSLLLVLASPTYALPPLSNGPLFQGGNVTPNVMFTLDDSGSMQWEVMPDDLLFVYNMFPRMAAGVYGGADYFNFTADFDPTNFVTTLLRSAHNNRIYYDPAVTYTPWSNADGSLMANAPINCAPHNPMNPGLGCRDFTVANTQTATWRRAGAWDTVADTFWPAVYFNFNGGSIWAPANYTQVEIRSTTPTYPRAASRTDCGSGATCSYAQEIQNFANWYTYYRSRVLLARAGVGKAFAAQGSNMRVGFAAINKASTAVDGVATPVVIQGVRQFTGTDRTDFFNSLYNHVIPAAGTPLRTALDSVGRYYERTDALGPWGEFPGVGGGTQHACRQSYNILMTDGYWNDVFTGVGNADGTAGTAITNHATPATPPTFTYAPAAPFTDAWSDTLADVAMHYWKRDLRPDLDNKVFTNTADPAFWQHMSTFTAGLGVSGTLPPPPAAPGAWPDPALGNPQRLDDLWHAAVNGRGDFFSAANPTQFANGLSAALTEINARTGSASAVATSSTKLDANGRTYQAKFNGDWSGALLAYPIDAHGVLGPLDWDAGVAINALAPSSRVILTKGSSDGVEFQYAALTPAQKGDLDKNATGATDGCGLERVAYLRGDASNEGTSGTFTCGGGSIIDKFRSRPISKLGDIVNSGPLFVGKPSAGYSDVDHPGYTAFSSAAGYKNRTPMIYVGANDGMLHGFNACIDGVTPGCTAADEGKELLAYVPSMVYANLSRLTDKNYNSNHRYFVDGSPMTADVDTGTSTVPAWKSILVGSMNAGGQGYFALDITNPADASKSAPRFATANAADLVLWEFTNADDADMGYSYNLPPSDRETGQAAQIVKMKNGKWAVVVGNGYNSTGGKAVLYVLFIKDGEDGVWTLGTDYIKLVADPCVSPCTGNGLSTPVPYDSDGDGLADVIYAGDLKGNMWKFDVSSATPASWHVAFGGAAFFEAGKPITSPPVISLHPLGGQLVLFGTGKYLETSDVTSTSVQTMYAVWDDPVSPFAPVAVSDLVTQTMTASGSGRITSMLPVNYSVGSPVVKGWRMDFSVGGERLTGIPSLEDGILTFNSIMPSASPCDSGGSGKVYSLNYLTGSMLGAPAFDTDGDGDVDASDGIYGGWEIGFVPGGVTRMSSTSKDVLVFSKSDGTLGKLVVPPSPIQSKGRVNWRELVQ